jgi:hypothetical protein
LEKCGFLKNFFFEIFFSSLFNLKFSAFRSPFTGEASGLNLNYKNYYNTKTPKRAKNKKIFP